MRSAIAALLIIGTLAGALVAVQEKKEEPAQARPKPKFTLSKETTYITGPLDKDGYPDYAAALNERLRQGVTPENNAAVLLFKAWGPRPEGEPVPDEFFLRLGMTRPAETGEYFTELSYYLEEILKVDSVLEIDEIKDKFLGPTIMRPWSAKDYRELALWLGWNEKPLGLMVEASKRTQYFSPYVVKKKSEKDFGLMSARIITARSAANALVSRAMVRVGQGSDDEAWQDLLACHRLARLTGRGGQVIEALSGIGIDLITGRADLAYLDRPTLTAKRVEACLRDLNGLATLPKAADKLEIGARFEFLDILMWLCQFMEEELARIPSDKVPKEFEALAKKGHYPVDWDTALRNGNRWYNRVSAAVCISDRADRQRELDKLDNEIKALATTYKLDEALLEGGLPAITAVRLLRQLLDLQDVKDQQERIDRIRQISVLLGEEVANIMILKTLPSASRLRGADDRATQRHNNLLVAFALAWYHRDHGRYPKELSELAPKYLPEIPLDIFSGKPLIYRLTDNGYLLYSVGPNGQDDGGRGPEDDPRGDDIAVGMPLPELPKK